MDSLYNYPTRSPEALLAATNATESLTQHVENSADIVMPEEHKNEIFNMLRGGLSYFYELACEAGELYGRGDAIGALALLGGEENARDLIGDEYTDELLFAVAAHIDSSIE